MPYGLDILNDWQGRNIPEKERGQIQFSIDSHGLSIWTDAPYFADPAPATPPGSTDRLWEYEVVELFFVSDNGRYMEIEMGPHGHYLVLLLKGIRCLEKAHIPMEFQSVVKDKRWQGKARILLRYLPLPLMGANAFAIHGPAEQRRYLCAFPTGGDQPDFHQPAFFPPLSSLVLPPPGP
ncbi:hypothetical protein OOT00_08450 [Desulfobotulus sp. H1]|uniref:Uncharacterized protein n=1 Tax=Desulfobotulus pelophilus TaxID=2823377 RepID=A0ABT3N981_9BACT|nr:hypothetical protein [Desulfobotulus pelophilus]MCW7754015.1 hypothetical protein [Desulfobotulus pelophilus]